MNVIRLLAALLAFGSIGGAWNESALAAAYPVSGKWAYERSASQEGDCRSGPFMQFKGDRRFDNGGNVPDYRNKSVSQTGESLYRVVDLFFTGQIRGQVTYTLHLADADHIEIWLAPRGTLIKLRRCA